jgi:hypothetical protein
MLDGVGESGDKACMRAMHATGQVKRSTVFLTAVDAVACRAATMVRPTAVPKAHCWQILKARTTVPLRARARYGAV